jgi:hypothetical protein
MSFIKVPKVQIGTNVDAAKNFVLSSNNDGTAKLARGTIDGTTQDILTVDAAGTPRFTQALVVLQRVRTVSTTPLTTTAVILIDDTVPQSNEGVEYMTAIVTPKVIGSRLTVRFAQNCAIGTGGSASICGLFRDAEVSAVCATAGTSPAAGYLFPMALVYEMVAPSLAPITFRIRVGVSAGSTGTFNGANGQRYLGGVMQATLSVEETI